MTLESLRSSQLPLAFLCPGSARPAEMLIDPHHDEGALGTAAHAAMEAIVNGEDVDVSELAARHCVDAKDLGLLVWYGRKAWDSLRAEFAGPCAPVTELELKTEAGFLKSACVELTGHIDLVQDIGKGVVVAADWKTGRKEASYYNQAAGYAALLMADDATLQEVRFSVVWLRDQEVQRWTFTVDKIADWIRDLATKVINWDGVYHPGAHCTGCRRNHACPALTAMVRRDVEMFAQCQTIDLTAMPGASLADMERRQKTVSAFAASLHKAIKAEVQARGGSVDCGDGSKLELVEENGHREIDVLKSWGLLSSSYSAEEMAGFVSISATALDDVTAKKAGRGKGAEAKRNLRAELDKLGAIKQPKVTKLKELKG